LASVRKTKTVAKLQAVKKDLESKVAAAKAALKTVQDKKTKAKIQADIAAAQARIRQIKGEIAGIKGKSVAINITTRRTIIRENKTVGGGSQVANAVGVGWNAALSGAASSRTAPPTVNVAAPEVSTRIFIDGREIRTVARSTVLDENRRQAYRARVGRR